MRQDSTTFLKLAKYSGIGISASLVLGIVTLMVLARGKGEDIAGIVAPALLLAIVSGIIAIVAALMQGRAQRAINLKNEEEGPS